MKNYILKFYSYVTMVALLFATSCNEDVSIEETIVSPPEITSFTPASAPVGSEIYITGESLHNVISAQIGGKDVTILERVSNSQLTIVADIEGASGAITLVNANGSTSSEEKFTYQYNAPTVAADCQMNIEMGEKMLIMGENLASTTNVYFIALNGSTDETLYEATINSKSNTEILVTVPYVSEDAAELILEYYNGSSTIQYSTAHEVVIQRDRPIIDAFTLTEAVVGRTVSLTGSYMNKTAYVTVGGKTASISVSTDTTLSFTVPTNSDYVDGYNENQEVCVYFFDGYEYESLSTTFKVYVPYVNYWQDILTWAQSREAESLTCFFSLSDGVVYANSNWQYLDTTAVELSGAVSAGSNYPNTTQEQYDAVLPYFFFSVTNGGNIAPYSPNTSNSQLKNYYSTSSSDSSITGGSSWYGTPSLGFRVLESGSSVQAESDLYYSVVNAEIENINETLFPIDVDNSTIAGVSVTSISASPNDTTWATGVFTDYYPGTGANAGQNLSYPCDVVFMVLYYTYDKADTSTGSSKALDKVKRLGFIHLKNVEYIYDTNGYAKASSFLYNVYWQKYDYDYDKVVL